MNALARPLADRFRRLLADRRARLGAALVAAAGWALLGAGRGGAGPAGSAGLDGPRRESFRPDEVVVVDGDTLLVRGRELRFLGVDTPERGAPWFEGDQEPWASRASGLVRGALDRAGAVVVLSRGARDAYGRELVHVLAGEEPLALLLVEAGLAYPTVDRYGDGGFPELAARIRARARQPRFEPPWRWRRAHRREPGS